VDVDPLFDVLHHAAEHLRRSLFVVFFAGQLRSQQDDLLFGGKALPGIDHVGCPVAGAMQQHHNRQGTLGVGRTVPRTVRNVLRRIVKISLLDARAVHAPGFHIRDRTAGNENTGKKKPADQPNFSALPHATPFFSQKA
jgi:hypothetical protein